MFVDSSIRGSCCCAASPGPAAGSWTASSPTPGPGSARRAAGSAASASSPVKGAVSTLSTTQVPGRRRGAGTRARLWPGSERVSLYVSASGWELLSAGECLRVWSSPLVCRYSEGYICSCIYLYLYLLHARCRVGGCGAASRLLLRSPDQLPILGSEGGAPGPGEEATR